MTNIDLESLTSKLGQAYRDWKENEEKKNALKDQFFSLLTSTIDRQTAATQIVYVGEVADKEEAKAFALKRNPGWKVIATYMDVPKEGPPVWSVSLEEDLTYKPAAYINRKEGMVYQRTVAEGATYLDDEEIRENNPELWAAITREKVIEEMIPLEELDAEIIEQLSEYVYRGAPSVRFLAPRPVREDEIE
jgi:uncharacterized membrane protein YkoI